MDFICRRPHFGRNLIFADFYQVIVGLGAMNLEHTNVPEMGTNYHRRNGDGMAIGSMFTKKEKLMIVDGNMLLIFLRERYLYH